MWIVRSNTVEANTFQIEFADLIIDFRSEFSLQVPQELLPFLRQDGCPADTYELKILQQPLVSQGQRIYNRKGITAYREGDGTLLLYGDETDGQVIFGTRIRRSGHHTIYVRQDATQHMAFGSRLGGIMNGEELLLRHYAMVLHSSLVSYKGRGILFSGPSGVGKSTQAALWEKNFGATVLNGDRAVIRQRDNGFIASGSPWCGSSGIYSRESVPVDAIVLLRQGKENQISLAEPKIAFREIYSQSIVHNWDIYFVDRICDLVEKLVSSVPVYILSCLPDPSAPIFTEKILFRR